MELVSADHNGDGIDWAEAIPSMEAEGRLKQLFYEFMEIDWVPPEKAVALAQEKERPMVEGSPAEQAGVMAGDLVTRN